MFKLEHLNIFPVDLRDVLLTWAGSGPLDIGTSICLLTTDSPGT